MIELLLLVCLKADPTDCEERRLTFAEPELTPIACAMQAQPTIAHYMARLPEREVARWKCGPAGETAFYDRPAGERI